MPSFQYAAQDRFGIKIKGVADAPSQRDLSELLSKRGFTLISAESKTAKAKRNFVRVNRRDLIDLTHNLAMLESSGVPLFEGLTDLAEQVENAQMQPIFNELVADVARGKPLSEAMSKFPGVFPPIYIHIISAGEKSGSLDHVLERLAHHLEWKNSVRGLVKQMLIYPSILLTAVLGLVIFLLVFLIPRLMGIYASSKVELPKPTQILIAAADFLTQYGIFLLSGAVFAVIGLLIYRKSKAGRIHIDQIVLGLPWIGPVARKASAAQFAATLSTLYRAGVDLEQALEITSEVVENGAMSHAIKKAQAKVLAGTPLSEAIKSTNQFQPLVSRMIAIGERAGKLEEALGKVVIFYDREVPAAVKRFMSFIEPAITIVAGFVVGFIVLCAILPIFKLFDAIKR